MDGVRPGRPTSSSTPSTALRSIATPTGEIDPVLRELGQTRAGWVKGSQFVFSQHCKSLRGLGVSEEKIAAVPYWTVSDLFDDKERAVLAYADCLAQAGGRTPDEVFDKLKTFWDDEQIFEFTYITCLYDMHAVITRALRMEFDDRDDPIVEVAAPKDFKAADFLSTHAQEQLTAIPHGEDRRMSKQANAEFEIRGVNHLALTCRDMAKTVEFYRDVLGMPLTKTIDLPGGMGQHFFFDIGNGDSLAFFWFPNAPERQPGVASPQALPGEGSMITAHGSMNHIAFDVPAEKFDEYCARLKAKGVEDLDGDEPRRLAGPGQPRAAPRRLRPLGLLLRPRRRLPRIRLLDARDDRRRRRPRPDDRRGRQGRRRDRQGREARSAGADDRQLGSTDHRPPARRPHAARPAPARLHAK